MTWPPPTTIPESFDLCEAAGVDGTGRFAPMPPPEPAHTSHPALKFSDAILVDTVLGAFPGWSCRITLRNGDVIEGVIDGIGYQDSYDWTDDIIHIGHWEARGFGHEVRYGDIESIYYF